MLSQEEFFKFEDKDRDFPYYRNSNLLRERNGLIIISSLLVFMFLIFGPVKFYNYQEQVILSFVMLIPLLYILKDDMGTFFRKPGWDDLRTVIFSCIAYLPYIFIVFVVFYFPLKILFGIDIVDVPHVVSQELGLLDLLFEFIQIIGEELFRVMLFLVALTVMYRYTGNRKLSVGISVLIALLGFGLMHLNSYPNVFYCLIMMGVGTFFDFYPYLKTKNVLLSIVAHFIINILIILVKLAP